MKRTKYLLVLLLLFILATIIRGYFYYHSDREMTEETEKETTNAGSGPSLTSPSSSSSSSSSSSRSLATNTAVTSPSNTETILRQLFLQGQDPEVQVTLELQEQSQLGDEYLVQFTSPSGPSALRALVNPLSGKIIRTWAGTKWKEHFRDHNHNHEESLTLEITGTL